MPHTGHSPKNRRWLIVALVMAIALALPYALLVAIRPDFAFDKRHRAVPMSLTEDPNIAVIEYRWLKGSQVMFSDGKRGSGFSAVGLVYIGYRDGEATKYRWASHLSTSTTYDLDCTKPGQRPKNVKTTITLR
jgi:uncharacterized protein (UPF0128 family)